MSMKDEILGSTFLIIRTGFYEWSCDEGNHPALLVFLLDELVHLYQLNVPPYFIAVLLCNIVFSS